MVQFQLKFEWGVGTTDDNEDDELIQMGESYQDEDDMVEY